MCKHIIKIIFQVLMIREFRALHNFSHLTTLFINIQTLGISWKLVMFWNLLTTEIPQNPVIPKPNPMLNIIGFKIIFMYKYNQNIIHSICKTQTQPKL